MYKKILLSLIGIYSLISAQNLPVEKLEQVKKLTHHEKYMAEKQAAINNLKRGGVAALTAPTLFLSCCAIMGNGGLGGEKKLRENLGRIPTDVIGGAMLISVAALAVYSVYKLGIGAKHYFAPTYPNPEKAKN